MTASALSPNANDMASATLNRAALVVAPALDEAVTRLSPSLQAPVRHHLAGGGKRVRAALSLVSAAAAGSTEEIGVPGAVAIEHALREAGIAPAPELVAKVMNEVKRIREERAERADFSEFHRRYYDHLNRLGLTGEEVADIARALASTA